MAEEGEKVLVRVFREGLHRWEPGHVEEVLGDRMVRVKLQSGPVVTRHLDQVQLESFSPSAEIDTNIDSDEDIVSNDADQIIPPVEQAEDAIPVEQEEEPPGNAISAPTPLTPQHLSLYPLLVQWYQLHSKQPQLKIVTQLV